jgi:hypothetical protein
MKSVKSTVSYMMLSKLAGQCWPMFDSKIYHIIWRNTQWKVHDKRDEFIEVITDITWHGYKHDIS